MKLFATRRQCEQIIIALMATFGSRDESALKMINIINKALIMQCETDKTHYIPTTANLMSLTEKEDKK